jgi:hypothetical protein
VIQLRKREMINITDDPLGHGVRNTQENLPTWTLPDPNSKKELDRRLDQALADTFPASDPISIIICPGLERESGTWLYRIPVEKNSKVSHQRTLFFAGL